MIELVAQLVQAFGTVDRIKSGSVSCSKRNTLPEGIGNDQNIGKQDCTIESESANWLQRNFGC